jgi:hypothetical protein
MISNSELDTFMQLLQKLQSSIREKTNRDNIVLIVDSVDVSFLSAKSWPDTSDISDILDHPEELVRCEYFLDAQETLQEILNTLTPRQKALNEARGSLSQESLKELGLDLDDVPKPEEKSYETVVMSAAKDLYQALSSNSNAVAFTMQVDNETVTLIESNSWVESEDLLSGCTKNNVSSSLKYQCMFYNP